MNRPDIDYIEQMWEDNKGLPIIKRPLVFYQNRIPELISYIRDLENEINKLEIIIENYKNLKI